MMLADIGADVIRVEPCHDIDMFRLFGHTQGRTSGENASATFHMLNCNKLGIALDLIHEGAREHILRLRESAMQ